MDGDLYVLTVRVRKRSNLRGDLARFLKALARRYDMECLEARPANPGDGPRVRKVRTRKATI